MLDENLPTFTYRPSSDKSSTTSILYYTAHGSDPEPSYVFRRADPASTPGVHGKYAAALTDPHATGVVYAEVLVTPTWQQPTLSAAEIRANGAADPAAAPIPLVPENFTIQLYEPDQRVEVKMVSGSWGRSETWEFEMPTQTFKTPSASQLDRQQQARERQGSPEDDVVRDIAPKIMFKWKRDGKLTKDMTAYMVGRSLGRHRSKKEPDITVALFQAGKESAVAIYEPNMQRVEVEDRKGLDIVLLLGAEVIRDLYLTPKQDLFNIAGAAAAGSRPVGGNAASRPVANAAVRPGGPAMSGALRTNPNVPTIGQNAAPPKVAAATPAVDAETVRLRKMVEQEERQKEQERKAREQEAQRQTEALLAREEAEQRERARRAAEVDKETERLKKLYGVEGQALPSQTPALPPRPGQGGSTGGVFTPPLGQPHLAAPWQGGPVPPRPVSAGPPGHVQYGPPPTQAQESGSGSGGSSWWRGAGTGGRRRGSDEERKKMKKKRSVHF